MKKIYSLMAALGMAMGISASAYTVNITIDDPAAGYVKNNSTGETYEFAEGQTTITLEDLDGYQYLYLNLNTGYKFTSASYSYGGYSYSTTPSGSSYSMSVGPYYDEFTYEFETSNLAESRTESCTINVSGSLDKFYLKLYDSSVYSYYDAAVESLGENTFYFAPTETQLYIYPNSGYTIYSVKLDGVAQTANQYNNAYTVNLTKGCVIDIDTDFPDKDCTITIDTDDQDCIQYIVVNGEQTTEWESPLTLKAGDTFGFYIPSNDWKINALYINDAQVSFYGTYSTTVTDDMDIYIDVAPYGSVTFYVTIDDASAITYYPGYYSYTDPVALVDGRNELTISENGASYTYLYFLPNDGYYITSCTCDTRSVYSTSYPAGAYYSYGISEGDEIVITTGKIVRDKTAVIYVSGLSDATNYDKSRYGIYLNDGNRQSVSLVEGYQTLTYGDYDGAYTFGANANSPSDWCFVYKNGSALDWTTSTTILPALADGDVLKIYVADEAPASCTVTISSNDDDAVIIADKINTVTESEITVLSGTEIEIKTESNVVVNDETATGVEGVYTITITADTKIEIGAEADGISSVSVDRLNGKVYNLQGIEMRRDNLPAGIYIIDGKKVMVK